MPSLLDKVKNKLGLKKSPVGHKLGGGSDSQQQQHPPQAKPQGRKQQQLSEEEKESRRGAMAAAAANREKAWDTKVNKGAQARRQEEKQRQEKEQSHRAEGVGCEIRSEETLRTVQETKRQEQQLAQSMGYNPYQPVMSSSSAAKGGGASAVSQLPPSLSRTTSGSADTSVESFDDVDWEVKQQLVAALECLLLQSLPGVSDERLRNINTSFPQTEEAAAFEQGRGCVNTVCKMLTNVANNPADNKFRWVAGNSFLPS
jgi:hypothetical protein